MYTLQQQLECQTVMFLHINSAVTATFVSRSERPFQWRSQEFDLGGGIRFN